MDEGTKNLVEDCKNLLNKEISIRLENFDSITNIKTVYVNSNKDYSFRVIVGVDPIKFIGDYLVLGSMVDYMSGAADSVGFSFNYAFNITGEQEDIQTAQKLLFNVR